MLDCLSEICDLHVEFAPLGLSKPDLIFGSDMEKRGGFGFACRGALAMLVRFDDGEVLQRGDNWSRMSHFTVLTLIMKLM